MAIDMLDRAVQRPQGRPELNGVNHPIYDEDEKVRDRSTKHLRRLREDRPDLHAKVLSQEMTVTEAAVTAGLYPPRIAINLKSPPIFPPRDPRLITVVRPVYMT